MQSTKIVGIAIILVGIIALIISFLADVIGIGGQINVFGYKQIIGIAVGAVALVVGLILLVRK
jgi:hypothetical protein